jgi:hypothetical protein
MIVVPGGFLGRWEALGVRVDHGASRFGVLADGVPHLLGDLGGEVSLGVCDQGHDVAAEFRSRSIASIIVDIEPDELAAGPDGNRQKPVTAPRFTSQSSHPLRKINSAPRPRVDTGNPRVQPFLGRIHITHDASPMWAL